MQSPLLTESNHDTAQAGATQALALELQAAPFASTLVAAVHGKHTTRQQLHHWLHTSLKFFLYSPYSMSRKEG